MKIHPAAAARSFTLVELLVVVAIIGLLAGLGLMAFRNGMGLGLSWWAMRRFRFAPELRGPNGREGAA